MKKSYLVVLALLMLGVQSEARKLSFSKSIVSRQDSENLVTELETATGFSFVAASSTSIVNGWVYSYPGTVEVYLHETLDPNEARISSVTWTQDLQDTISTAIENHTP